MRHSPTIARLKHTAVSDTFWYFAGFSWLISLLEGIKGDASGAQFFVMVGIISVLIGIVGRFIERATL